MVHRILLVGLAVSALACRSERTPASRLERLEQMLARWDRPNGPGLAVMVVDHGKPVLQRGYGVADRETGEAVTAQTQFLLCSVSKQFTSMAIMQLVEREQIAYGDSVAKFLPELPSWAGKVTVRHLLTHTSGVPDHEKLLLDHRRIHKQSHPTVQDALDVVREHGRLQFTPGSRFQYSKTGYVLLGQIVERVSQKSLAEYLAQNVFQPLGMRSTLVYDQTRPALPRRAHSYLSGGEPRAASPFELIYGQDNVFSNLEDLFAWDQALYTEQLVTKQAVAMATTCTRLADGRSVPYGFGWAESRRRGEAFWGHAGYARGYGASIARWPGRGVTIVVLSAGGGVNPSEASAEIADIYFGNGA